MSTLMRVRSLYGRFLKLCGLFAGLMTFAVMCLVVTNVVLRYLFNSRNWPHASDMHRTFDYFYGHYYAVQAMWQAGDPGWQRWYPAIRDMLVARQQQTGSWKDRVCNEYGTAMACLVLQTPNSYLPIFQR